MSRKNEPWYIHAILTVIILGLIYLLIQVSIIEPNEVVKMESYYKSESRLRMENIRQAEIFWEDRNDKYTDNLDSLFWLISADTSITNLFGKVDTLTGKSLDPFKPLTVGSFVIDSLFKTPKSFRPYILQVDTTVSIDTVINRRGRIVGIDTVVTIGTRYYLEDPDGYGSIGDLYSDALRNTASWE